MITLPTVPGTSTTPMTTPERKGLNPYLSWRIFAIKAAIPAPNSEPDVIAKVLKMKTGVFINWSVAGKISFSFPWILSSFCGMCPSLKACSRMLLAPGNSLGNPRTRPEMMRRTEPPARYPSHQAPIHRGSSGLRLTPSGWKVTHETTTSNETGLMKARGCGS